MTEITQGHGVEGKYGGLPEEYCNKDSKIVILPVPFDKTTTYQQGTDQGPGALIEASRNLELYDIETDFEAYKEGIFTAPSVTQESSEEMLAEVEKEVLGYLKKGKFVVTLGGEHSISPAPIRAHAEHFGPISVLQFDAHADLQPAYEGNPLSHASAMSRVKETKNVKNLVAVGIRSMSNEELPYLDRKSTFFAHDIVDSSDWMEKVVGQLSEKVYITFDLDVFDSSIMPSTGTPEPGGLNWYQAVKLLKLVATKRTIVGADIVELCPKESDPAPDFLAAKLVYKLLSYTFKSAHSKQR